MSVVHHPERNLLLGGLSDAERQRVFPHLELVELKGETVLYEPYEPLQHAYFPITSVIFVLCELRNGDSLEFKILGSEGFFGLALLLGAQVSSRRALVHRSGHAYRLRARTLREEFARGGSMHDLLLRYVQAVITHTTQTVACNRHHAVEQQLCRWLLNYFDRSHTDSVNITHQRIAGMLGVRRESVTLAARHLRRLGVISYRRGDISVLDRPRLERLSCECYGVVRKEWKRLLEYDRMVSTATG